METKIFEVRDRCTFFPVLATSMVSADKKENYLLGRAGYAGKKRLILLTVLTSYCSKYLPDAWQGRTLQTVHNYISKNWDILVSSDVIDVEFILGETSEPKQSERLLHLPGSD